VYCRLFDAFEPHDYDRAVRTLSSDERERADRFALARDRVAFVIAHGLLRDALSRYHAVEPSEWRFAADQYGRPALARDFTQIDVDFNLAHTDGLVACAVTRSNRVGIDAETIDKKIDEELTSRYLSPKEAAEVATHSVEEQTVRFLELWTLKEAAVKAIGLGLSESLQRFSFLLEGPSIYFEDTVAAGMGWSFALFAPSPRHRIAVAVRRSVDVVRVTLCRTDDTPPAVFLCGST
jgi:4'-phosphopantetheinyl transferase